MDGFNVQTRIIPRQDPLYSEKIKKKSTNRIKKYIDQNKIFDIYQCINSCNKKVFIDHKTSILDFDKDLILLMLKSNIKSLQKDHNISNIQWETYVVRKSGWKGLYGFSNQQTYGTMMHFSVQEAAYYLKKGNTNFNYLLNFLRNRRRKIAMCLQSYHSASASFGILRECGSQTYCEKDYAVIPNRLIQRLTNFPTENVTIDSEGRLQQTEKLNGIAIRLSNYEFYDLEMRLSSSTRELGIVYHTSCENAKIVMDYVEHKLFPQALKEEDPEKLLDDLGRIFWWICQAKPWHRGDPSIAETLIRAVLVSKGLENPPWEIDLIPWVEVTVEPEVEEFAKKFHTLFDWSRKAV